MVYEKNKFMVQVYKREILVYNKNRIIYLKKNSIKNYILLYFFIYVCIYMYVYFYI